MKVGMIADLHMNLFRRHNPFFIHVENSIYQFKRICKEQKVDTVFILGDLFHTKYHISTEALIRANTLISSLSNEWKVVIVRGNHDLADPNNLDINLCENYKHFDNVDVIDDYDYMYDAMPGRVRFHFLAHSEGKTIVDRINNISLSKGVKNILCSHIAVNGFFWHDNFADYKSMVDSTLLSDFDKVFLGHFHGYQTDGHITYVSAPLQSKYGDENAQHGFVIYDTETNEHTFHPNISTPQFITLDFNKPNIKKSFELTNHYIRFIVSKHVSKRLLDGVREELLCDNYDVDFKFNIDNRLLSFTTIQNWDQIDFTTLDELFANYLKQIKTIPENTTREELLQVILS